MLLLTSTNDRLQIITSSAATITVHASWVDTSAGVITPGRTNTAISAAATTSVAGNPAASTQRNVKTLHVRNTHASAPCDITVQHTDGTVVAQLYKVTLAAGDALEYTDQAGFGGGRAPAPPAASSVPNVQTFTVAGTSTFTATLGMKWVLIECCGGGGGGIGLTAASTVSWSGHAGGAAGYSRKILSAAQVAAAAPITITVGAGGNGSPNNNTAASSGGDTSFGALCIAKGGQGATVGGAGGLGGSATGAIGDVTISGQTGESLKTWAYGYGAGQGGMGGSSFYGGGGAGTGGFATNAPGLNATGFGSGGGGANLNGTGTYAGGNGSGGLCVVTEFFG